MNTAVRTFKIIAHKHGATSQICLQITDTHDNIEVFTNWLLNILSNILSSLKLKEFSFSCTVQEETVDFPALKATVELICEVNGRKTNLFLKVGQLD